MATGSLTIQARTAYDALPLPGVSVRILDAQNQLLYDLTTDESGRTETDAVCVGNVVPGLYSRVCLCLEG